jgi:hypothetical protein
MSNLVHTDLRGGVAVVTVDNPPVNALSPSVWAAIDDAMFHADTIGLPVVLRRVEVFRARLGDHWKPARLLARLAAEGRGFYDSPSPGHPTLSPP